MNVFLLQITLDKGYEDIIDSIIEENYDNLNILGNNTEFNVNDPSHAISNIYSETEEYAKSNMEFIKNKLDHTENDFSANYNISLIDSDDYLYSYMNVLKPFKIGSITIVPNLKNEENSNISPPVIYIGRQYAFGTGTHETTSLALYLMDYYKKNMEKNENISVADIGCGSGILSLASSILFSNNITSVDNDEMAVSCTIDNIEYNNFDIDKNNVFLGSAKTLYEKKLTYDIVVANIETDILVEIIPYLVKILKEENSTLILSGILNTKKSIMLKSIEAYKLKILKEESKGDWTAFLCSN